MMNTMRENTKWIMLVTAIAFVGLMVFEWGMDLSGQTSAQASGGVIGEINGEPVNYEEFLTVYRGLYDQAQGAQEEPISTAQNREIEQAAWDQLVMDRLIRQEVRRRRLEATEAEVRQAARLAPPPEFFTNELFQTDGQFDPAKYQQFLASPAVDDQLLLQLEAYYRDVIPRNKLYRQVVSGAYLSDGELWRMWRDQKETARVRFVAMDPETIIPDAAVSVADKEVAAFYSEHKQDFRRPAKASIRLVVLEKSATAADSAAAREHALKVRQEIVGGADFAEVARRESQDPGSAAQGGDLGTFQRGQMVPAFDQAVWSLPVGQVTQPVLTPFGYHIIKVENRSGDEARARHVLLPIAPSTATEDATLERADSLETLGETMKIAEAAARLGLSVRTADINPELPLVAGIGRIDDGADWAFNDAGPGDVSPVFEAPGAFYMLELVESTPAGTLTLQDATPGIRARLLVQKKLEKAREKGRELVDQVRNSSLDQAAAAGGLEVREAGPFTRVDFVPGLGRANAAIGTAFGLAAGHTSGVVEADGALYVIQVVERQQADRAAFDAEKDGLRARVAAGMEQERWVQFLAALKERARIVDNRASLLQAADDPQQ